MKDHHETCLRRSTLSDFERLRRLRSGVVRNRLLLNSVVVATAMLGAANATPQDSTTTTKQSTNEQAANGRRLFVKFGCYECHGFEAQGGGSAGPRIGPDPPPLSALIGYVRAPAREMPPYTDKIISDKELADIFEFLKSLPHPPAAFPESLKH
jgi:mono/diheme cytochrome c family protein